MLLYFFFSDINYLKTILPPTVEEEYFEFLRTLSTNDVVLSAIPEGSVVFPRVPLIRVEGPLPGTLLIFLEGAGGSLIYVY